MGGSHHEGMRHPLRARAWNRYLPAALVAALSLLTASASAQYEIGFESKPDYLDPKDVVLTFDDGPAWGDDTFNTLEILSQRKVKATFFVNTAPGIATDWAEWGKAAAAVKRIIADGHLLA